MIKPLSHLEILIYAALQQHSLPREERNIDDIVIRIDQEKERILATIYDEQNLDTYVRTRQHQLVRLLDQMDVTCPLVMLDDVYRNIYGTLLDLLNFLERDFAAYMDEDCKIPLTHLFMTQTHMSSAIMEFDNYEMDVEFRELITAPFKKLLAATNMNSFYSYYEIVYLTRLVGQLPLTPQEEWTELLLTFDFNDPGYVKYLVEMFRLEMRGMPEERLKRELLFHWQKLLNQVPVLPGMHYKKLHKPLRKQLHDWIAEELSCMEKCALIDVPLQDGSEGGRALAEDIRKVTFNLQF